MDSGGQKLLRAAPDGVPLADNEIIVLGGNSQPGNFKLYPKDHLPLGGVTEPGISASIATDLTLAGEIRRAFSRGLKDGDILSGASVADIRAAGFDAIYAPTNRNYLHVRIIARERTFDEVGRVWLSAAFDRLAKVNKVGRR